MYLGSAGPTSSLILPEQGTRAQSEVKSREALNSTAQMFARGRGIWLVTQTQERSTCNDGSKVWRDEATVQRTSRMTERL